MLWQRRGPLAEGVLRLDRLLGLDDARGRPSPSQVRAAAVLTAGTLACFIGDYPRRPSWPGAPSSCASHSATRSAWAVAYRLQGEAALAWAAHGTAGHAFAAS